LRPVERAFFGEAARTIKGKSLLNVVIEFGNELLWDITPPKELFMIGFPQRCVMTALDYETSQASTEKMKRTCLQSLGIVGEFIL